MPQETRKDEIVSTAAKLFKEKGYSAVTMRDLAKAMGIKAASLYNHINSKQDLLATIIISLAEDFTSGMNTIKESKEGSLEKLKKIVALHIDITSQNAFGMASLNNDWMHLEEKKEYYLELRKTYENDFRKIIKDGIAANELNNVNSEVALFSILSTLRSLYLWMPKKEGIQKGKVTEELIEVLLHGINK
jgi:AcrR family transcriptional regulator